MRGLNYLRKLFERGIMFAVTHIDIQFLNPARYADTIDVISIMTCKRNVACVFHHKAINVNGSGNTTVFATATTKIFPADSQRDPVQIPEDVLHQIKENALAAKYSI